MIGRDVRRIVVPIPACNESRHVVRSLEAVTAAIDELPSDLEVWVVVACDSCDDDTASLARSFARSRPEVHVIEGTWGAAGFARAAAVEYGLALIEHARIGQTWIATTDADTHPSPTWLSRQLHYAHLGFDAVAGIVTLIDDEDCSPPVHSSFTRTYEIGEDTHPHVHAANLGFRADVYIAAGGFPRVALAEDHMLWDLIGELGCARVSPVDVVVATSARLRGRAAGGFADTLASLQHDAADTLASVQDDVEVHA